MKRALQKILKVLKKMLLKFLYRETKNNIANEDVIYHMYAFHSSFFIHL